MCTIYASSPMFLLYALLLLQQAGGDGGQLVSVVPAGLTRLFQHPTLDWNLFSTRQQPLTDREVRTLSAAVHGAPTHYSAAPKQLTAGQLCKPAAGRL